jgi:hypothetical protein
VRIIKALYSPTKFAIFFSTSYLGFYLFWGTSDIENAPKFDRAFAARYSGIQLGDMAVTDGVASYWGIPLFDATQGFGYRLPTQGSLGQSPFIFLRWIASVEVIQLAYLTAALFLCSWTIGQFCRERLGKSSEFATFVLHLALLGPLLLFSVVNEWQSAAVAFCSRAVLIIFVFYLARSQGNETEIVLNPLICSAAATAFFLIVIGHPGEWALALPPLVMIFILLIQRWKYSRCGVYKRLFKVCFSPPFVIVGCAIFSFLIIVSDLLYESNRPVSSSLRIAQRFGIEFQQLPTFSSLGKHSAFVEVFVALLMATFGPVVNLFFETSGRYEFVALPLLLLVAVRFLFRSRSKQSNHGNMVRLGLILASVIFGQYSGELLGLVPGPIQSSGAYQHAPQLLIVSVILWCISNQQSAWSSRSNLGSDLKKKIGTILSSGATTIALVGILIQPFSLLKLTSPEGMRNYRSAVKQTELKLKADFRTADFLYIPDWHESSHSWLAPGYVRAFEGFPVLENEPKLRNASTLNLNPVFNQLVYSPNLSSDEFSLFRDFASIINIFGVGASKTYQNGLNADKASEKIGISSESKIAVTTQRSFHTFLIHQRDLAKDESRCPLLELASCIQQVTNEIVSPRPTPRWKLGKGNVLATYDWDNPSGAWGVLIPMDYDSALKVKEQESGKVLDTYSHYGLLVAELPDSKNSGKFQIYVEPDWRMKSRSLASYLSLLCLVYSLIKIFQARRSQLI